MTVYERIRITREIKGMTQSELAKKVGYSNHSAIAKIEAGQHDITIKTLEKIANALNVPPMFFMTWSKN